MAGDCLFCKIVNGEMNTDFLFENERIAVFRDIHPAAPVHLLVVPKKHIRSINDIAQSDEALLGEMISVAKDMAKECGVAASGYKLLFNVEKGGGQVIFHLHLHVIGGWKDRKK
ncbi:MAG: histidine triad nucleotide-binding protein [Desulfococcaceae bacterium]|jgi:histidine triad (HIT) family protein|nr:histidine triad nucleotide-binding protein [Desulfococcaceae bacterium]